MQRRVPRGSALAALAGLFAAAARPASAARPDAPRITLTETGSTLFYPLFRAWAIGYAKSTSRVRLVVQASTSETGIARAVAGIVQLGGSDEFMSDRAVEAAPNIINVPLAVSAQDVVYNIPSLPRGVHLKLDGPVLAAIYSGAVRMWDAPDIAALNPGVTLPHRTIVPVRREDGSGNTFAFSQYLAFTTPAWDELIGYHTTVPWPSVAGAIDTSSNAEMLSALRAHPYSIGYLGTGLGRDIAHDGLEIAMLKNAAGNFLLPTQRSVLAAADKLAERTPPDERVSLVFAPGSGSYPLASYAYAIVSTKQLDAAVAAAMRDFLFWAIAPCNGNAEPYLDIAGFVALPEFVRAKSYVQIAAIR